MLGLLLLIFITIASGSLSIYLYYYPGEISFIYLYPYFFGTLFIQGFFILCIMSLVVYAYRLKNSKKSTHAEIVFSKFLLWMIGTVLIFSTIAYFIYLLNLSSDEYKIERYLKFYVND